MPKLLLFEGKPIDPEAIASFRTLFEHPGTDTNKEILQDLQKLHNDPQSAASERLALFVITAGLIRSLMLENFLVNCASRPQRRGKPAAMQLEINQRILACAAAAGFLPVEPPT